MGVLREMHNEGDFLRNRISRLSGPVRYGKQVLLPLLIAAAILARGGWAVAALPPPSFMPGFPLVAGPQIIFMWSPVIGAEKYRVYLDGKSVAEVAAFQHILPLPKEGKHSYYVVAVDKEGKESPAGKAFEYEVRSLKAPKNVASLIREKKIAIRWDPSEGALVYDVFRGETLEGPFQLIGSTQDTAIVDANVKPGQQYYYRVASKDATGTNSEQTEPVLAMVEPEQEAAPAKRLQVLKTKKTWEIKGIENSAEVLTISDNRFAVLSPMGYYGSSVVILSNPGTPEEKRTTLLPPEEDRKNNTRFGGMGLAQDGRNIWVTNIQDMKVYQIDPERGAIVDTVLIDPIPKTRMPYHFQDVAEAPNGDLYLSEEANQSIMVVRKGKIVSMIGGKTAEEGRLAAPSSIFVVDGMVLVSDGVTGSITFFGLDGKYIRRVGRLGGRDPMTFSRLSSVAIDREKKWIFAGDMATTQIQIFDYEGNFIAMLSNEDGTGGLGADNSGLALRDDQLLVSWSGAGMVLSYQLMGPPAERN